MDEVTPGVHDEAGHGGSRDGRVSRRLSLLHRLLVYAAGLSPAGAFASEDGFAYVDLRELQWTLDAGLGPLLYRATADAHRRMPEALGDRLRSEDLTARLRHANLVDTALEVIGACASLQLQPTLLKGISIGEQCYPEAHSRPMGDIDVLIPAEAYDDVEAAVLALGYARADGPAVPGLQHGIPIVHPGRNVWVELHTSLFADNALLRHNELFNKSRVAEWSIDAQFHGRSVRRLSDELQLVYIASSWHNDMTNSRIHPSFVASLFDAVYLLKSSGRTLDWDLLVERLDNEMAAASLYVTLAFLGRRRLATIPPRALTRIAARQRFVGPVQLRIIDAVLDRHLLGAKPWTLRLPLPVPGRYSVRRQFEKRVLGAWRKARL